MIVVAEKLSEIAVAERVEEYADSYGRSAFNRYYYASYLITREMLRQLDHSWTRTPHSQIPGLLRGAVITKVRRQLRLQRRQGGFRISELASIGHEANTATAELSTLLKNAYEVRRIADYEPEQKISRNGRMIKLGEQTMEAARNWPKRASSYTGMLIKIWRQLGLI